ncbi:ADP-ribosylation factor-like protein 2-binding protein [Habropoda laboriosa]|uniref:ADP-ribosylation factor-like protein 2-binding protein n=1 Tax=Habropoda laboriosa TaxID=597456 RepID=A0A0L7R5L8_9HYME|nr:ADP-ribosylation factor-like protein 2-binding protein [Habropoda laboriosa]
MEQNSKSIEDNQFDEIIGHIEDILLEDEFHAIRNKFLDNYWDVFEPKEEKSIPHFSIHQFLEYLKQNELEGEVFEVLSTFTDFMAFKEMFLDYRAVKEGKVQDLSSGISVISFKTNNTIDNDSIE